MEGNIGSTNCEGDKLKRTFLLKAKKANINNLKTLGQMLKVPQCLTLTRKYGKILDLLKVNKQVEAITTLA